MENTLPETSPTTFNSEVPVTSPASTHPFKIAVIGLLLLVPLVGAAGYYVGKQRATTALTPTNSGKSAVSNPVASVPPTEANQVMCTMDAKLCPDGSSVGRTGPNCEFAECPANTGWQLVTVPHCNLELRMPPQDFKLDNPAEMDRGRIWDLQQHTLDQTAKPFTHMVNINYQNTDGLGSGYAAGAIIVECAPNPEKLSTSQLFEAVKQQRETLSNEFMTFTAEKTGEAQISNQPAIKFQFRGGQEIPENSMYVLATATHLYRLSYTSMSTTPELKTTTQQIFESIAIK